MKTSAGIYRKRIDKVIDYINSNLDQNISLEQLAGIACFSPFHFHRIFAALTGETVKNFTNRIRMEKAARLLRFSRKKISDISSECGFADATSFSRLFRQYFGITPTDYRKGGKIKNSKIRQVLYPANAYHCNSDHEELKRKFPVEIRTFPRRRIAYLRVVDAFRDGVVVEAFREMTAWSKEHRLFDSEIIFGMSLDDPEVTPKEKYRYEVCISLPEDFSIGHESSMQTTILPECRYAVTKVSGDINEVASAINYMFDIWLINSDYECGHLHALEIFRDKENICNWEHFELEFCIPVKALKS